MIVLRGRPKRIDRIGFSPDGTTLAAPSYAGTLQLWRGPPFDGPAELHPEAGYVLDVQFAPPGGRLLLGGGQPRVYDPGRRHTTPLPAWNGYWHFAVQPDGQRFVLAGNNSPSIPPTFRIACRPTAAPADDAAAWTLTVPGAVWSRPVFLADGARFVLVEADQSTTYRWYRYRFVIRSAATGEIDAEVRPLADDTHPYGLTASPDGRWLATLRATRIPVYDTADLSRPAVELRNDNRREFTGLAFHPSGRYLAATSNDATVKLYDTASWQLAKTFTWDVGRMRCIAFSPDGTLAAAGSDTGKVVVWDVDL
jgi:WD40 repeat protein